MYRIAYLLFLTFLPIEVLGQGSIVINATLISPERSAPLENAWVRIEDGRISAIGSGQTDTTGLSVTDASGAYLIPGLIDSHVHIYHATGLKRRYSDNFTTLYSAYMAQQPRSFLYYGFTSVIELNADEAANARFENAPVRPRLFHCSQGVILSDGFMSLELEDEPVGDVYPGYLIDHHSGGRIPDGADASRHTPAAAVEHVRSKGGRCIKLYYEEALWWPGGAPEFRLPSVAIVRDVVRAARAAGMPVLLHATTPAGHRFAIETGVDAVAHGMWEWTGQEFDAPEPLPEYAAIARNIAESGIAVQPTITTIRNTASMFEPQVLDDPQWANAVPRAYLDYLKTDAQQQRNLFVEMFASAFPANTTVDDLPRLQSAFGARYLRLLGSMVADGANLLFATDTAVGGFGWAAPPGLAGYWEILALQKAGVTTEAMLAALTINNAKAFRLEAELGTIEVGKRADMLILRDNPLVDAAAYDSISLVITDGKIYPREALSARHADR